MKVEADTKEKLSERKLLALSPTLMSRLKGVAAMIDEDESEIIRRGLVVELDRIESAVSIETKRLAKMKAIAEAQGGDIDAVLDRLLQQMTDPELPLAVEAGR